MNDQPARSGLPEETEETVRRAAVALRSIGHPNSIVHAYDFWDESYAWRRLFSEVLGTFFLVLVAVGAGMVNARFGGQAVPYGARVVAPTATRTRKKVPRSSENKRRHRNRSSQKS